MSKRKDYSVSGEGFESPFAALLKDVVPEKRIEKTTSETEVVADKVPGNSDGDPIRGARLHLQKSRKGRGGKTTTTIGGFPAGTSLKSLAKELGKSLGCGAFVEDGLIVIQGDQRERLKGLLLNRGASQVK